MRNISELIGIIRGISFDNNISDREIQRVFSWIDKNRNLTYEQKNADLLKSIEKILAEGEAGKLLLCIDNFIINTGRETEKIYEFNGIIDGVLCDDEINKIEISQLREWVVNNKELLGDTKTNEELCRVIDEILSDGRVSEHEAQHLKNMLKNIVIDSRFETKLNNLCKKVKEKNNIGVDLIELLDNESAMNEIHRRAERQLYSALMSSSNFCTNHEIIVVSLVLIAMLEYNRGNYYDSVQSTYQRLYRDFNSRKIEEVIRSILCRYRKLNESSDRKRIISVALEHAIVPQLYLTTFFEFIFDIYKLNFDYDLSDEIYEDFKFVYEGLREKMLSPGDEISINVTQKTYKLTAATKQLIAKEEGLDPIIKLSIIIAKLIDKGYWEKEVKIFNPYLKVGYEGWVKQVKEVSDGVRGKREFTSEMRSRWKPKFVMENEKVYLVPPHHRVKSQYDYRDIAVIVLNEDEEIYRNEDCYIKEIIGGYEIIPPKIEIDQPLERVTYRLVCGEEVIYDSKDVLYRDYIVFNTEGQEISNNTDYEGGISVCYKQSEASFDATYVKDGFSIGYSFVNIGDVIRIGDDVFSFSSILKPGVFGQLYENCSLITSDGKHLPIYMEVKVIAFEAEKSSDKFEVLINGNRYKLSEMQYRITERETVNKFVVDLKLNKNDIYTIEVNQIIAGKKNEILKERFVYDADLGYEKEKINDYLYRIEIYSGLLEDVISTEISPSEFDTEMFKINYNNEEYRYYLPFDFGFYSIDDSIWKSAAEDLWIEDILLNSSLRLFDYECDEVIAYNDRGVLIEDNIAINNKGLYKEISIGFLNSYKRFNSYVKLVFSAAGKQKYIMFCYNKCVFDEEKTEILFFDNPKQIIITPSFHGNNPVFFEMFDKDGNKVASSRLLKSGESQTIDGFTSFEEYKINFHEKTKILMLRKNTLIHTINKSFYDKQDFIGKRFKIDEAYYYKYVNNEEKEKQCSIKDTYIHFTKKNENGMFEGIIMLRKYNHSFVLRRINPVEVEICGDIIDDKMAVYITNNEDGLLLDYKNHEIYDRLEDHTAPDIFLYTVCLKEENKNG